MSILMNTFVFHIPRDNYKVDGLGGQGCEVLGNFQGFLPFEGSFD